MDESFEAGQKKDRHADWWDALSTALLRKKVLRRKDNGTYLHCNIATHYK